MKHTYKILFLLGIGLGLFSCESFLDINDNPNVATEADPNLLFVSQSIGMSNNRTSEIWIPIGITAQVFASGGSVGWGTDEDQYNISIFSTGNTWRELYTNAIKNASLSIEAASKASPVNNNAIAQHKIFQAYAYWELTSIFGDVPFSEVANPEISQPKFDSQADVLQGILDLLDDAIAIVDVASPLKIAKDDLYYGGDMENWTKLANSLKLRILMMMVDAQPGKSTEIASLITADNGLSSNDENFQLPYFDQAGNYNPEFDLFYTFNGGVNNWLFAINHTTDLLKSKGDPRISYFYDEGPEAPEGVFNSIAPAAAANTDMDAVVGSFFLQPDSPDRLLTYSEHLLLQAEAHARGFVGNMTNADTKLRAGIRSNMEYFGIANDEINVYLAGIPDLSTLSQTDAIKTIAEQQWLDLYNRPLEAWVQWRRTEVPALQPPSGTLTANIIRRWHYPPREVSANTNTPEQKNLDEKMWFDK